MADDILQILFVRRHTDSVISNMFFEDVLKYKPSKFKKETSHYMETRTHSFWCAWNLYVLNIAIFGFTVSATPVSDLNNKPWKNWWTFPAAQANPSRVIYFVVVVGLSVMINLRWENIYYMYNTNRHESWKSIRSLTVWCGNWWITGTKTMSL
jgi:hypothetical protein